MTDSSASIDPETLGNLLADTGSEVMPELVRVFLDTADVRMGRMAEALAAGRPKDVAAEAHALKSSSATFGAQVVRRLCAELEAACNGANQSGAPGLMAELTAALDAARLALTEFVETLER